MKKYWCENTKIGIITVAEEEGTITEITFGDIVLGIKEKTPLIKNAFHQLDEYFAKKRTSFDLPLKLAGTPFQLKVWNSLLEIPYGETRSYKDIAIMINNPLSCRAIGMANHNNPIAIVVPCHRVIGSNHKLVGYGGGLDKKIFLLELENSLQNK